MHYFLQISRQIYWITIGLFLCISGVSYAQDEEELEGGQLWGDYNPSYLLSDKWMLTGDLGVRGLMTNIDWNQFLIRPTIRYVVNQSFNFQFSPGMFSTFNMGALDVNELRFTLDFQADGPDLLYVLPFYRLRIEQRNFFYYDPELQNNSNWRARALIGLESFDIRGFSEDRFFYFQAIYEGFLTLDEESATETFINQARIHAAFGHKLSQKFRYEIHYIWQLSREFSDDGLETNQNILRLRFYHFFGVRNKKNLENN